MGISTMTFWLTAAATHRGSYAHFDTDWSDSVYANDTSFDNFFTGAVNFTVKEIEVCEIADSTALPVYLKKCANGRLFQEMARDAGGRLRAD
jgi:hypothetical protein